MLLPSFNRYVNESRESEIQTLLDVIASTGNQKYVDMLWDKYGIKYENKDRHIIDTANLSHIYSKDDFLSYDSYVKYAKKIFSLRGIPLFPKQVDITVYRDEMLMVANQLGFRINFVRSYTGNYASASSGVMNIPDEVSISIFIHELGHIYDYHIVKGYDGIAKDSCYASSPYGIGKADEVFAENFLAYFIYPEILKKYLPQVYRELNSNINRKTANAINRFVSSRMMGNPLVL